MSDRTPPSQATQPDAAKNEPVDASRRKLTGAALGASAIFTLSSRPVWANQCSISGMASGNLSAPEQVTCGGCTPGYWKQCQHLDSWLPTGFSPDDSFNAVFGVTQYVQRNNKPYTLLDVLGLTGNTGGKKADCSALPDGYAVAEMGQDPISPNLGFHAVAALLNAAHPGVEYGYTASELIQLFRNNLHRAAELKDSLALMNERGCPLN